MMWILCLFEKEEEDEEEAKTFLSIKIILLIIANEG